MKVHRLQSWTAAAVMVFVLGAASAAQAGTIAYIVDAGSVGIQAFGGSLGLDFDVNANPIFVSHIGVFDDSSDGLNLDITAAIFDRTTQLEVPGTQTLFTGAAPGDLVDGSRFKKLASAVELDAFGQYSVVAWGYGDGELNGNSGGPLTKSTDDAGGVITFVGGGRFGDPGTPGSWPHAGDGGPVNRYTAGTFEYDVIPEPTTLVLAALGLCGLIACGRRRRQRG